MRLFIAVNFSEELLDNLCNTIEKLKDISIKGNFTLRNNLHLTLVFLGEVHKIDLVKSTMDKVSFEEFEISIGGLSKFSRKSSDIYWVGVENNNTLSTIYKQLSDELRNSGFNIENREYKPHLTIGRGVVLNKEITFKTTPAKHKVGKISLMKSERFNGVLTYTEIYNIKCLYT